MKRARPSRATIRTTLDGAAGAALAAARRASIVHKRKAVIVCEGWDASGKGGAIQRLTAECDPRAYQVWPIAAPTEEEKARHYLWRFWQRLPEAGEVAIFDRSWYGRVLVERVEGFADARPNGAAPMTRSTSSRPSSPPTARSSSSCSSTSPRRRRTSGCSARLDHPWKRWKVSERGFPQPRPPRGLSRRDQGHVRRRPTRAGRRGR